MISPQPTASFSCGEFIFLWDCEGPGPHELEVNFYSPEQSKEVKFELDQDESHISECNPCSSNCEWQDLDYIICIRKKLQTGIYNISDCIDYSIFLVKSCCEEWESHCNSNGKTSYCGLAGKLTDKNYCTRFRVNCFWRSDPNEEWIFGGSTPFYYEDY